MTINTLKYLRMKEDDLNLQIDAAIAFSVLNMALMLVLSL